MNFKTILSASVLSFALAASSAMAHPGHDELPDSYAVEGATMSFFSTPNRKHIMINGDSVTTLGKVVVNLAQDSDVLIQFTSGLATITADGCPCSVRASIAVDDHDPIVIKRVNLGAQVTQIDGKYQPDRQSADGSFVLPLAKGRHEISLVAQKVDGKSTALHAFYPNMQAIVFNRQTSK
ncbi:hypothetical protein MRBLMA1_002283 [Sphingobium sp. LMA1-1-1.1]|uniref:hypothetical protein n=1 Tax=unclassified Sphingobium TaxID=2611147 RepID=UPI003417316D